MTSLSLSLYRTRRRIHYRNVSNNGPFSPLRPTEHVSDRLPYHVLGPCEGKVNGSSDFGARDSPPSFSFCFLPFSRPPLTDHRRRLPTAQRRRRSTLRWESHGQQPPVRRHAALFLTVTLPPAGSPPLRKAAPPLRKAAPPLRLRSTSSWAQHVATLRLWRR